MTQPDPPAIETRGLGKVYRPWFRKSGHLALQAVDLTVPAGTIFGLIGPNGAGKTTFIKTILGIIFPTGGMVRLFGRPPQDKVARQRVGYLPERLDLPKDWTPHSFLTSVARLRRIPRAAREIERQLARVDLTADARRKVGGFSKGMRQRLGLAAALLGAPELLILDEPTDGIDPLHRREVRNILLEENARGATILLNSHLLSETEKICQRVGILHQGRLLKEDTMLALTEWGRGWWLTVPPDTDPTLLQELGLSCPDDRWYIDVPDAAALTRTVDALRAKDIVIVELVKNTPSLEDVLTQIVKEAST